jgi:hypothetical protein
MDNHDKGGKQWEGNEDNRSDTINREEDKVTPTDSQGGVGGVIPLLYEVMCQLEEMSKRDALMEEQHKADVTKIREALATATNTPYEEAGREQPFATETV